MTTARDIIKAALRKIAVLGTGASLDANEANDALGTLNAMIASWSAEGNMVYVETKETFSLTNERIYTIGSGANFDTVRPISIKSAYVTQGNTDYSISQYNNKQYSSISSKDTTSGIPDVYYYDGDFPTAKIYLHPAPTSVSTITINSIKPLAEFTGLTTEFSLPAEYLLALEYNLAVLIAPEYEREASPTVRQVANQSKATVAAQMAKRGYSTSATDAPSMGGYGGYNIYEGDI